MYKKIFKIHGPPPVFVKFVLILSLAYFPLWSFLMSLKNDALTLSYPLFYFYSHQIAMGSVPWWHFNIHLGLPLHADPGFPFWSPLTLVASLFGSSLFVYTLLVYAYIVIGGIGMIKLTRWLRLNPPVQLMLALGFVLSGFFSAHLQHPHYLFEAAFLPFVFLGFLRSVYSPGLKNSIFLAIGVFFLVNSGYPSFSIGLAYFLAVTLACIALFDRNSLRSGAGKIILFLLIAVAFAFVLCLPYLYSLYQFFPFFNRSQPVSASYLDTGGITPQSLLSLLFPLPSVTSPDFFQTNIAWSNLYIGLVPLLFILYGIRSAKNRFLFCLLVPAAFMLLASAAGQPKELFQRILPGFDRLASNGGLRVFFMMNCLLTAGYGLNAYLLLPDGRRFRQAVGIFLALVLASGIAMFLNAEPAVRADGFVEFFKSIPLRDAILIQGFILLSIIGILLFVRLRTTTILAVGIGELVISFLLTLPYTGLGRNNTFAVQHKLDSIIDDTKSSGQNTVYVDTTATDRFFRTPVFYQDRIAFSPRQIYPSRIARRPDLEIYRGLDSFPAVFSAVERTRGGVTQAPEHFTIGGDRIEFTFNSLYDNDTLVIMQNFYPNWELTANDQRARIVSTGEGMLGVLVNKGINHVEIRYCPRSVLFCLVLSIFAWIALGILLLKQRKTHVHRHS